MYINELILYPVSYGNRITIILETDDLLDIQQGTELWSSAFQLRARAIKPTSLLSHYFLYFVAGRVQAGKHKA